MRYRPLCIAAIGAASVAGAAAAGVPDYDTFELQCRANFGSAFNLPPGSFFTSGTPVINDDAEVAIRMLNVIGTNERAIWFGSTGSGQLVYFSPNDSEALFSDCDINNGAFIVTSLSGVTPYGVVRIDAHAMTGGIVINPGLPFGVTSFGSATINNNGQIGYRGSIGFLGQIFVSWDNGSQAIHAADVNVDPNSPYSFIFTPDFNDQRRIAAKVRIGGPGQTGESQPDQIRLFDSDGSSAIIAEDADAAPGSPYSRFDNSVSLANNGRVAFIATLVGGGRGVYLSEPIANGVSTIEIANTNTSPEVTDIEFFAPCANDNGLVTFRGFDHNGRRAVFVGDGVTLKRIVGHLDIVPTDLGPGRIEQHDASPVFGGAPKINNRGDVVFNAALTPPDNNQIEWGSGVFIAYASVDCPGDTNGDGVVDFTDFSAVLGQYGQTGVGLSGDLNGDGVVDFTDFSEVLANYGNAC